MSCLSISKMEDEIIGPRVDALNAFEVEERAEV